MNDRFTVQQLTRKDMLPLPVFLFVLFVLNLVMRHAVDKWANLLEAVFFITGAFLVLAFIRVGWKSSKRFIVELGASSITIGNKTYHVDHIQSIKLSKTLLVLRMKGKPFGEAYYVPFSERLNIAKHLDLYAYQHHISKEIDLRS